MILFLAAIMSGLGACLRFACDDVLLAGATRRLFGGRIPVSTFLINVSGSFALGIVLAWADQLGATTVLLLAGGFLAGFTTLSAVSMQSVEMLRQRRVLLALAYTSLTLSVALAGIAGGYHLPGAVDRLSALI